VQRGNNRQALYTSDKDIAAYAKWLHEGAVEFGVLIHGWAFMTNHVHLLVTPASDDAVSRLFQFLGRLYVRHFNFAYARSGTLFEGRFKSSLVQEDRYFLACLRYIELNPVRAGMVQEPGAYHWSSYHAHGFGMSPKMWTPHVTYLALGSTAAERQQRYRRLMSEVLDQEVIAKIRHCAHTGLVLGTEQFRAQIAKVLG
jgi:putative transposase